MDIQFKLYAIEMGGWTSWYNSGELVSTGNAPATNLKVGLLNAPDITLNATINGKTYNDIKTQLNTVKEEIINNYKEDVGEEKYNEQVKEYEEKKEEVKEVVEPIIDEIIEAGVEIYETSKNSFDKWYQEWKEEQ